MKLLKRFNYKQAIVIRKDLKISKGKLCVQVAHASITSAHYTRQKKPLWYERWFLEGQKKVVLKVNTLEDLIKLEKKARDSGLVTAIIKDAGLTEIPPGTTTALGIGPAPENEIDKITGELKLL